MKSFLGQKKKCYNCEAGCILSSCDRNIHLSGQKAQLCAQIFRNGFHIGIHGLQLWTVGQFATKSGAVHLYSSAQPPLSTQHILSPKAKRDDIIAGTQTFSLDILLHFLIIVSRSPVARFAGEPTCDKLLPLQLLK